MEDDFKEVLFFQAKIRVDGTKVSFSHSAIKAKPQK